MKNRPRNKKAGIIFLAALIIIALAEIIFRAVAMGETALTTSNLGEQLAVIVLAVTILILTVKGKDRACYICYGAWAGYFVLDQLFELFGVIIRVLNLMGQEEAAIVGIVVGGIIRVAIMGGIIAIGVLLAEYMTDGTIYNRAFNGICITTVLLIAANIVLSINGTITVDSTFILDTFYNLYRMVMVFMIAFFAYDSAKHQLKKANLSK